MIYIQQILDQHRNTRIIIMIDDELSDELTDPVARKESLRTRKLVKVHLAKVDSSKVFLVDDLEQMLKILEDLCRSPEKMATILLNEYKKKI